MRATLVSVALTHQPLVSTKGGKAAGRRQTAATGVSGVGLSSVNFQSDARSACISSARHACDRNGASGMGDSAINASTAFVLH